MANAAGPMVEFLNWTNLVFSRLNMRFEHSAPQHILGWGLENYGQGLTIGTSFGASGMALMDMALEIQPDVDIFYIDTGYFFPETEALIARAEARYGRTFRRVATPLSVDDQAQQYGPRLYERDPDLCCYLRKVEPLETALKSATAWVTALRRDQSSSRAKTPAVSWNERYNVVKIAPLSMWTEEEIWAYIREHDVPYNQLHDRDYPSIGCWPCTRAVRPGDDPRSGRWFGTSKVECGLHVAR